jgi:hypothetical protein
MRNARESKIRQPPKARDDDVGWAGEIETGDADRTGCRSGHAKDFEAGQATSTCRVIACGERGNSMSIDQEANDITAQVSFFGMTSNAMTSNAMTSNAMALSATASHVLSGTRISCASDRGLYPPSMSSSPHLSPH